MAIHAVAVPNFEPLVSTAVDAERRIVSHGETKIARVSIGLLVVGRDLNGRKAVVHIDFD